MKHWNEGRLGCVWKKISKHLHWHVVYVFLLQQWDQRIKRYVVHLNISVSFLFVSCFIGTLELCIMTSWYIASNYFEMVDILLHRLQSFYHRRQKTMRRYTTTLSMPVWTSGEECWMNRTDTVLLRYRGLFQWPSVHSSRASNHVVVVSEVTENTNATYIS